MLDRCFVAHLDDPSILIQEVSTRDGLQNEPQVLTVSQRIQIIDALAKAGLRRIQVGALVNPRLVPQMADSDRVWLSLDHNNRNVCYTVLVLNERGMETALNLKLDHIEIYVSASETHSLEKLTHGTRDRFGQCCKNGLHREGSRDWSHRRNHVRIWLPL